MDAFDSNVPLPEGFSFQFVPQMTLRDYFAAKALPALLTDIRNEDDAARHAYRQADAMLKAREA